MQRLIGRSESNALQFRVADGGRRTQSLSGAHAIAVMTFSKLKIHPKSGEEHFAYGKALLPFALIDFWRWSTSDLIANTTRGALAEFIVSKALGIDSKAVREEWAPWDFTTPEGTKVEVKSAAYIQSWHQKRPTKISFSTAKTLAWDANTGEYDSVVKRQADVYVFALLANQDQQPIDPLDTSQWLFWVVPTSKLDSRKRSQHSITLPSLISLAGEGIKFDLIRAGVLRAAPSLPQ